MPTLTFDSTGWEQDEKTMIVASVVGAAYWDCNPRVSTAGHSQARWSGSNVSVDLPAADPTDVLQLTETVVRARYATDKAARDAAQAAYEEEVAAQEVFVAGDPILTAKVATIKGYCDQTETDIAAAGNAAQYRAAMLRLLTIERNILKLLYHRGLIGVR